MKSGLFVSVPALFFFFFLFWSNPHNPLGVICSCSVIWGKASLSPLSLQLYLHFIPSSTSHTLIFTVICKRAAMIGCSAASKLHPTDDIILLNMCERVCVCPHMCRFTKPPPPHLCWIKNKNHPPTQMNQWAQSRVTWPQQEFPACPRLLSSPPPHSSILKWYIYVKASPIWPQTVFIEWNSETQLPVTV